MRTLLGALALAVIMGCYPTDPGVSSDVRILEVRAGGKTACALTDEGPTLCWGDNQYGQLGNGTMEPSLVPAPMALSPQFADIAVRGDATCALDQAGAPLCWGSNIGGTDIHDGSTLLRPQGVLVQDRFASVTTGCGIRADHRVVCWGGGFIDAPSDDRYLSVGYPCSISLDHELLCGDEWPSPSGDFPPVKALDQDYPLMCVLTDDGSPLCWGALSLYDPRDTTAGEFVSDTLSGLSGERRYVVISVGGTHGCGLDAGGVASCWGDNTHGQIGDGSTVHAMVSGVLRPTPVGGGLKFRSIAAGEDFTCGVTLEHQLYCWGANDRGQLGDGTSVPSLLPHPATLPVGES